MKTPSILQRLILLISCFSFVNCTQYNNSNCIYYEGFGYYMQDVFNINVKKIKKNKIYYLVPITNNCDMCVYLNLNFFFFIEKTNDIIPVLIGSEKETDYSREINVIKRKYKLVLNDKKSEVLNYETGFLKPVLYHIKNGRCKKYFEITDFKIKTVKQYLSHIKN